MARPSSARKVFVSSTSYDLKAYRMAVRDALLELGYYPLRMEEFVARDADATEASLDAVAEADLYLGIVAWRYGYILEGAAYSITQQEYLEAKRLGRPRLLFLAAEETLEDVEHFPLLWRTPTLHDQLFAFRQQLQTERVVAYFTTPEDLAHKVLASLARLGAARQVLELPPRAVGFVGRETELEQVLTILRREQSLGISAAVTGMGGVGKSALAAEAMHRLATDPEAFPGGITWIKCNEQMGTRGANWVYDQLLATWDSALTDQELIAVTTEEGEREVRERALRSRLHFSGPVLVLLDNIEPQFPLTPVLELLATLNITVLVTTRREQSSPRLRLLALPVLPTDPALQLFVERYTAQGGRWDEARDRLATLEIVDALGRLPLALELAAARAARMQVALSGLSQELREPGLLAKLKDIAEPNYNVRYLLGTTLAMLSPAQRVRFAALSLPDAPDVPLSIVVALFAAVPPDAPTDPTAEEDLALLATLSLVSLVAADGEGERRVRVHPLLRELAAEEWQRQDPSTQAAGTEGLLEGAYDFVQRHKQDFGMLAQEEDVLAGAVRRAARESVAPEGIIDTVDAWWNYLWIGGHWRLGVEMRTLELAAYQSQSNRRDEGRMLNELGLLADSLGRKEEAAAYFEQALTIWREVGDRAGEGTTLNNLGELARGQGKKEEVATYFEQALSIHREVGNRLMEGTTLSNLGVLAHDQGRREEAAGYYEQSLAITREVGDRAGEGTTLNNLGGLMNSLGRNEEAAGYYEQALAIQREVGDRFGEGTTLHNLGDLAVSQGDIEAAHGYFAAALQIFESIGAEPDIQEEQERLATLASRKEASPPSTIASSQVEEALPSQPSESQQRKRRRWPWSR